MGEDAVEHRGRRQRRSLRTTLLVPTLITISVGLAVFGLYIDRVERTNRIDDVDTELVRADNAGVQRPAPGRAGGAPPPPGGQDEEAASSGVDAVDPPIQLIVTPRGEIIVGIGQANPWSDEQVIELSTRRGTFTFDDDYRVLVRPLPNGELNVTALPLDDVWEALTDFRQALLFGGLVIIALQGAIAWFVTRSVTRPVAAMAAAASEIADGRLDTRIETQDGPRETVRLGSDLDRMVTRLRTALDASEAATLEAESARDEMQRFLADASHELRTPLAAIQGYGDLHAGGMLEDNAATDRAMARISDESRRLTTLVNDMLQLARTGIVDDEVAEFDVASVVGQVVDDLRAAHPGRTIALNVTGERASVVGAAGRIHQALLNLAANACAHTPVDTRVEIEVETTDDDPNGEAVVVRVIDHGAGIPVEERERVFQPFHRLDSSRARSESGGGGGAGLGLALTKQIVERHGGRIELADTLGGGATFTVTLPHAGTH